jgi:hypothetical protein
MKRRLKITALVLGLLLLLIVGLLAWVLTTESGLRFAVARLPERMGKVTLKIEDVRGTIAGERQRARECLAAAGRPHRGARSTR